MNITSWLILAIAQLFIAGSMQGGQCSFYKLHQPCSQAFQLFSSWWLTVKC